MNRMKSLRTSKGLSQQEVAKHLGVTQQAYANYERMARQADYETLKKLARLFNCSVDYLICAESKPVSAANAIRVPVLGYVVAGVPIDAIEDILDYEELDPSQFNSECQYFTLKIRGDSMMPRIQDGDVVIVRQQSDVESGDVAIVCINGSEATCKQIKKHADGITLVPYNTSYEPMFFTRQEVIEKPVTVLGKVVELRGKF